MSKQWFGAVFLFVSFVVTAQNKESSGFEDEWAAMDGWQEEAPSSLTWASFFDIAVGNRLQTDPALPRKTTLADLRLQLQSDYTFDASNIGFRGDLYYDGVKDNVEAKLRELYWQGNLGFLGRVGERFDFKAGQQILTWGTGDYLFLNDMFPKDYPSFFAGRDDDYLKAPSLSAKLSGYFSLLNIDVVITPQFEPDKGITGEYFSFFSPEVNKNVAPAFTVLEENRPDDAEYALRLYRTVSGTELAAYAYKGFTKLPKATDALGRPAYSDLTVIGFSALRPIGAGIAKLEYAFHDGDDIQGTNSLVPNDQSRFLVGYEQELVANLTGGVQWYTEVTHNGGALLANSPWPEYEPQERRHVFTTHLRYQILQQTLMLDAFNFWSPTDQDGFLRFKATYSPVDRWQMTAGANVFYGEDKYTFYSQFRDATNINVGLRFFFEG